MPQWHGDFLFFNALHAAPLSQICYFCRVNIDYCLHDMRHSLIAIAIAALLSACSGNKTEATVETIDTAQAMVIQIQQCSRLYTAEFKIRKIVTHVDKKTLKTAFFSTETTMELPFSQRRVAIPIDATVKAFVDFGEFTDSNVNIAGERVEIVLPDPKLSLTATRIDHDGVSKHVSLFRSRFTDEELGQYAREGRQEIIKEIPRSQFLRQSQENAARILIPMAERMGFKRENITITFRKDLTIDYLLRQLEPSIPQQR